MFLGDTSAGKAHEKRLAELAGSTLPPGNSLSHERGFQGCVLAGVTMFQPKKQPRGSELTPPEKATHRRIARMRVRIEHAMGGVTRDRIVKDTIRLVKDGIRDTSMETCCGRQNFRRQYRPWNYAT